MVGPGDQPAWKRHVGRAETRSVVAKMVCQDRCHVIAAAVLFHDFATFSDPILHKSGGVAGTTTLAVSP
uniref:Uncharacterized protein n=1 Tax=Salix viminalis TaxID=40686 RepID=A0A6N2MZ05_SALVM